MVAWIGGPEVARWTVRLWVFALVVWALAASGWRWAVTAWACYLLGTWCRLVVLPDLRATWVIRRAIHRSR